MNTEKTKNLLTFLGHPLVLMGLGIVVLIGIMASLTVWLDEAKDLVKKQDQVISTCRPYLEAIEADRMVEVEKKKLEKQEKKWQKANIEKQKKINNIKNILYQNQ